VAAAVVQTVPILVLLTYLATFGLTVVASIRLGGGHQPCEKYPTGTPCSISVYAGLPRHGFEEVIFRVGISICVIQCMVMTWGRVTLTGSFATVPLYVLTFISLMMMAFVPFWKSGLHHLGAGVAFIFLSIAQIIDTRHDTHASSALTLTRYGLIFSTAACWWTYGVALFLAIHLPYLEYAATILAFVYYLTWTYQHHSLGDASKDIMPHVQTRTRSGEDIAAIVVKTVPTTLLLTFITTLTLTVFASIRLSGGQPCDTSGILCDMFIYAAMPKHGIQEMIFRIGFSLVVIQFIMMACGRVTLTGKHTTVPLYFLTLICLTVTFVPFWPSGVHHLYAGASFLILCIAQIIDTCQDTHASPLLTHTRYGIMCLVGASWFVFGIGEVLLKIYCPVLEYFAEILAFGYFLTWTYQQHSMEQAQSLEVRDHQLLLDHP